MKETIELGGGTFIVQWLDDVTVAITAEVPPKVNVMLVNEEPKKRKRTVDQEKLRELELYFSSLTGLKRPAVKTARQKRAFAIRWWEPLREMIQLSDDMTHAKRQLREVVDTMRRDKLTISAPQSCANIFLARNASTTRVKEVW